MNVLVQAGRNCVCDVVTKPHLYSRLASDSIVSNSVLMVFNKRAQRNPEHLLLLPQRRFDVLCCVLNSTYDLYLVVKI